MATHTSFLDRSRIVAPQTWPRQLVIPAALSMQLAFGQLYAWSVFKIPLASTVLHHSPPSATLSALPFTVCVAILGASSALFGTTVDRRGPRWGMAVATACWSLGFLISALGVYIEQFWLVILGYGVVGGIGVGIGYISPISTLMKWSPDRPGLATGAAVMGFGGGALIASPWSTAMLTAFGAYGPHPQASGIAAALLIHGLVYLVFMSLGWLLIRVPPPGWEPPNPRVAKLTRPEPTIQMSARHALRTRQFWLLWIVLCFNVTAGIAILERAAPMYSDFFRNTTPSVRLSVTAAAFVAILSVANLLGRIGWSSTSDLVGRKNAYRIYLGGGAVLYTTMLITGNANKIVFLVCAALVLSFYGAGFATVPAYLRDLYGTREAGAIHGRLLTAWSVAGVLGPIMVNYIADQEKALGRTGPDLYSLSFEIMIALLIIGFICNEFIGPVNPIYSKKSE